MLGETGLGTVASRRMNGISSGQQAKRSIYAIVIALGLGTLAKPTFAELRINEFLSVNNDGLADGDGDTADWIEIYNPGAKTVSLNGWSLTDDAESPDKWLFPNVSLGARRYFVVFLSLIHI